MQPPVQAGGGGGACLGAALVLVAAAPAQAYGPLMHAVVADRAFAQVVPRQPWLAPFRDAFLWGGVAPDLHEASGARHLNHTRTHDPSLLATLWQAAQDPTGRAFVLGWAAHLGTDARADVPAPGFPGIAERDLCLEAALLPGASQHLQTLAVSAWRHAGGAAGAAVQGVLLGPLGLDGPTYAGWAGLTAAVAGRGPDRYLVQRARFLRLEPELGRLQGAAARQRLGDPTALVAEAAQAARAAVEQLLGNPPAQAPSARSGTPPTGRASTDLTVRATLIRPKP
ncbi:MAG: zinc dependent phospholipase C family protein [Candidatus Sericytochromatia bacterium]|nr:zinc dependent phospholipase C family protein [Candidatus Sericytochromatia bacterium]